MPPPRRPRPTDTYTNTPWERKPSESSKAFAAFRYYLKLGGDRLLVGVAEKLGTTTNNVTAWSSKHDWRARALAWDTHLGEVETKRQESVRAEYAERWERRRMEAADANWDRAQAVADRAAEMLRAPLYEQTVDEWHIDQETGEKRAVSVTYQPAKWTLDTAGKLLKLAAELQAAAVGEALGSVDDGFDPLTATVAECQAYLERVAGVGVVRGLPAPASVPTGEASRLGSEQNATGPDASCETTGPAGSEGE